MLAANSVRHGRRLMEKRAISPGKEYQSDDELIAGAGDMARTIPHPLGTCRMGSDPTSVMDTGCASMGSRSSATSTPRSCRRSSNSAVIMIAEKVAEMVSRMSR